ncbi:MAG: sulfatase, partial [Verrucomicrobiales bacterium]
YRYRMLAYAEWRKLFTEGKLNAAQSAFFQPKPVEMLFDLQEDPDEVNNLAQSPGHAALLEVMRDRLSYH